MSSGFFGVLQQDDSSDDDDDDDHDDQNDSSRTDTTSDKRHQQSTQNPKPAEIAADIPAYEDLSTSRADEETVLLAVYGRDFQRNQGVWGTARLEVQVRPPDVDAARIGNQLL
jgi:hypothetical protein